MAVAINKPTHRLLAAGWVIIAFYAIWSFGGQQATAAPLNPFLRNLVEQVLLSAFFIVLAMGYYNWKELGVFALVCFVVSNLFENTSVEYGFPFGFFEHSPALGPRLFHIPWLATPTYMAMGFISWMVSQVLVQRTRYVQWRQQVWTTPLVAAFVFTMWDFCNDPVFQMNKAFAYRHPGPWFGVPVSNFMGWLFVTFIFYGLFSFYLSRRNLEKDFRILPSKEFWLQAIVMYGAVAASGLFRNLTGKSFTAVLNGGQQWSSQVIYTSMSLTCLFTMVFVGILAGVQLNNLKEYDLHRRKRTSFLSIDSVM